MHKALIIDDNSTSRLLLQDILKFHGFQVWLSGTGEEGAALYQEIEPDVTLLDIHLPGICGIEVLRRIRKYQEQSTSVMPVIAVTAGAMLEVRNELGHSGFDAVFYKPVDLEVMMQTVQKLI